MKAKGKQTASKQVEEKVTELALPLAQELKLDLWDVRLERIGGNLILTIIIDKFEGVGIEDCETFSRAVDKLLDEADPISESYCLEVSSPGMNRELKKPNHFEAVMGEEIKVSLYKAFNGLKEFIGRLTAFSKDTVTIEYEDGELVFERKEISKVCLYDDDKFLGK